MVSTYEEFRREYPKSQPGDPVSVHYRNDLGLQEHLAGQLVAADPHTITVQGEFRHDIAWPRVDGLFLSYKRRLTSRT